MGKIQLKKNYLKRKEKFNGSCTASGGLGVKRVGSLGSPAAVHTRQSGMPRPATPCVSLGFGERILD